MIRGYFATVGTRRRPVIDAVFQFPSNGGQSFRVRLLVDTGADRTILSPVDARRLGIALAGLPRGLPSTRIGGQATTRTIEAVLTMDTFSIPLTLPIPEMTTPIPSLLGRDILSRFALYLEERTDRVLLLEPHEADGLNIPS